MTEIVEEKLRLLPDSPGVYIMKDAKGRIIYVGKAVVLKNRVRQYFQSGKHQAPKVRAMVAKIADFETILTHSEVEALILECNLIKKHRPRYNISLKDDKSYPYLKSRWPTSIRASWSRGASRKTARATSAPIRRQARCTRA